MIVSSHVLDEVERLGSQVLVMSQGRLAAAGDFRELRALDGRPADADPRAHRPPARARGGAARSRDRRRRAARRRSGARARHDGRPRAGACARAGRARPRRLACSRCARSTPTSRVSSATWCSDEQRTEAAAAVTARPGALGSLLALYRLLLRTQITVPRLLGIAALGALSVVIGLFARWDDNPAQAAADVRLRPTGWGSSCRSRRSGSAPRSSATSSRTACSPTSG